MDVLVSVLIPVYNTEKYVEECVNSICNQTLQEIEILCLDDGSVDESAQILDRLASHDTRIKVVHKKNSGYGSTMNLGIRMAKGKYIAIVESDDYIESEMLNTLYRIADSNGYDFVKSDYDFFWKDGTERIFENVHLTEQKDLYGRCLLAEDIKPMFRGYIANPTGIYRKKFLWENRIVHNETPGASYQDLGFFFQVLMKAQRGYLSDKSFYRYRQDNEASSIASKEKVFCVCDEYQFIYRKMMDSKEQFMQYLPIYQMFRFQSCLFTVKRIKESFRKNFLSRIREDFLESKNKGELDLSEFYEDEKEKLRLILYDMDFYLEELFKKPMKLRTIIKRYSEELIIYGAGACGSEVWEWIKDDISSFRFIVYAVSGRVPEKKYKHGLEVKCICDLKKYAESAVVIVAVTERYKKEIIKNLNALEFRNVVTLE